MAPRPDKPERARAEAAIRELLLAFGLDPEADPELEQTPARVVKAWTDVLLEGYQRDPARALGPKHPTTSNGAVVVREIPFVSMCPHHLLPLSGHAHVAFAPTGSVPGFGRIAKMIDALAHRLVLQEDLTQSIASTLVAALGAGAAVAVLEAQHFCVAVTDPPRAKAWFRTSASAGSAERAAELFRHLER